MRGLSFAALLSCAAGVAGLRVSRRAACAWTLGWIPAAAYARDYVAFDGNRRTNSAQKILPPVCRYGLTDGLFQDCRSVASCVSSQDDRPPCFLEPFAYDDTFEVARKKLLAALPRILPTAQLTAAEERYIRAENAVAKGVSDVMEWYFTPNDDTIQFRAEREGAPTDFGANRRNMERIRRAAGFDFVPVLRNRVRVLGAIESPLDGFGPNTNDLKWSLPPGMDPGDLLPNGVRGELDPLAPVFPTPSRKTRKILEESKAPLPLQK
eukprot:scaffold3290_cov259-Pinguiococcus_pyrenoidosus.AAC.7